jgi:endonuclease III
MLDRAVNADRAWAAAEWICDALSDPDDVASLWRTLQQMDKTRLRGFLRYGYGRRAFHRHYKTFARLLPEAADHLLTNYRGDPRRIWNGRRDVSDVRGALDGIPGIGPALAKVAVLILARDHGLLGGKKARKQLDVKPDVHVCRVFQRAGLIERGADSSAANREVVPWRL